MVCRSRKSIGCLLSGLLGIWLCVGSLNLQARTIPVELSEVKAQEIARELQLIGTVEAAESVGITSSVTERITQLYFEDGESVKAGQLLAKLDVQEEEAELSEALSVLKEAQQQFARLAPLVKKGASPKSTLDTAKQEVQSAQSRVHVIESRIAQHSIQAPFDGRLGIRQVSVGALMQPGQVLVFLDKADDFQLRLAVPVEFVDRLGVDTQVKLLNYPQLPGFSILSRDSRVQSSQALWVYAGLNDTKLKFQPGLRLPAVIEFDRQDAFVVPETAVVFKGKKASIFVVDENPKAGEQEGKPEEKGMSIKELAVEVGIRSNGLIQLTAGGKLGMSVVSQGAQQLKTGDRVTHVDL